MKAKASAHIRPVCSIVRALDVLADPWAFLILREAFFGFRRFEVFQRNLLIARNVLAERLSRLVDEGILDRRQYQDRPPRFEYRLTDAGRDFYPAIVALMAWGDRHRPQQGGPPLVLSHIACCAPLEPIVVCGDCGEPASPFDVEVEEGPGAGSETGAGVPATRYNTNSEFYFRGRPCSVAQALAVIGDRWSFRILRESFRGVKRFGDFQSDLGIARNTLAARLSRLVENGILRRRQYYDRPVRHEYLLTEAGRDLYPSLLLFMNWGDKWRRPELGVPLKLRHTKCGKELHPHLVCAECGGGVTAHNASYEMRYSAERDSRSERQVAVPGKAAD